MRHRSSSVELKRMNRNRVYRYIAKCEKTSIPEIAYALGMSVPTALQMVNDLKEIKVVEEVGEFKSTGGRKAKALATVKTSAYAVGIDITRNHVGMVLTDVSQQVLNHLRIRKVFCCNAEYFAEVADMLALFLEKNQVKNERVLGVGIAVPGIVDSNQMKISFSHALELRDVAMERYLSCFPFACNLINDAKAAVMTEQINNRSARNMVYLSLSNTVGGALVIGKEYLSQEEDEAKLFMGDNWRSGEFGHTVIHPSGKKCYCGKNGCLDAYCSAQVLSQYTDGNLEKFLQLMESGNNEFKKKWEIYLDDLAIAVDNLRMSFDCDVILGGYVGNCMAPYIDTFREKVAEKNIFGNTGGYVKECRYLVEASALGAAVFQIEKYISSI